MENMSRKIFIKLINLVILLIPISFLFHYIETSLFTNGSAFAILGAFLFIILIGIISARIEFNFIILTGILSILLSIMLGKMYIISPNESWFNPFGMNFAIVFVGTIILIGVLIVRLFVSEIIKK